MTCTRSAFLGEQKINGKNMTNLIILLLNLTLTEETNE